MTHCARSWYTKDTLTTPRFLDLFSGGFEIMNSNGIKTVFSLKDNEWQYTYICRLSQTVGLISHDYHVTVNRRTTAIKAGIEKPGSRGLCEHPGLWVSKEAAE